MDGEELNKVGKKTCCQTCKLGLVCNTDLHSQRKNIFKCQQCKHIYLGYPGPGRLEPEPQLPDDCPLWWEGADNHSWVNCFFCDQARAEYFRMCEEGE